MIILTTGKRLSSVVTPADIGLRHYPEWTISGIFFIVVFTSASCLTFLFVAAYTFNVARFHRKQLNESKGLAALLFYISKATAFLKKTFLIFDL